MDTFDDITCEEFYGEDLRELLAELAVDEANAELQLLADQLTNY